MKTSQSPLATICIFIVLTVALYFVGFWLIFRLSSATPLMLSVGLAAILTCLITGKDLRGLGWHWGSWHYQGLSYLLPLGYALLAYGLIWVFDLGSWYDPVFVESQKESYNLDAWSDTAVIALHFVLTATISFLLLLPSVLGEELAWRGLLVPELSRLMSFSGVALTSGFVWAVWHWPLMFLGLYGNEVTPLSYQLLCFTLSIMSMSVIMTYLRLKTGSVWTAVIFHMSHNVFLQKFFGPMTLEKENSAWFMDEFGAIFTIVLFLLAVYFWQKGTREFEAV